MSKKKLSERQKQENLIIRTEIDKRLIYAAQHDPEVVFKFLSTTRNGVSEDTVESRIKEYGSNKITSGEEKSLLSRITDSFVNPFTAILFMLALVSFVTDIFMPIRAGQPEEADYMTVIIIMTLVIVSGVLRFVQETRSGNAAAKLLAMITTTATVERINQGKKEIPLDEVVVGDIIYLSAGDMLPSDVRVIEAKDLFVSQSALTGESDPLEKIAITSNQKYDSLTEYENLAFMGSNVISGSAIAVVVATGDQTLFGTMAKSISKKAVVTSFEKGVNSVSWVLIRFMLVMVPVVFFLNGFRSGDWKDAFLFAISVAVGLTPEMLPMIVTTCLAKGAVSMSKKKTIIKNLNSIQNFGAMDILCTDKTGTITQDKIVLQHHYDVIGVESNRVLRYGFLNSYFQTGLKNLIDVSIIERTEFEAEEEESLKDLRERYKKIDEVPFDFARRRMSVVVEDLKGKTHMITKGAVEEMLEICSHVEYEGKIEVLGKELKNKLMSLVKDLNDDGMRVIAVAQKINPSPVGTFGVKDEMDMVLLGYLAFLDPPKKSTPKALEALLDAGVTTKILTGDNDRITRCVCRQVGMKIDRIILGTETDNMSDEKLKIEIEKTNVFAKLSPEQKARIVRLLRENGHVVGYMGDGINDAAAMKESDIGISVDTAVDIAKESADIILLEKDLMVLDDGIMEGRKTYANMIKYIKMTASSNFGNVFSVLLASAFLPFLPMMSIHLIVLNLIYDISCTAIPWDNVDEEFLHKPRKWDASSVGAFMLWIGPTSSIFDLTTYLVMYFIICPMFVSDGLIYSQIPDSDVATKAMYIAMFQTGWFVESMWSQTLVIHMIRTPKIPFIQSIASFPLITITSIGIAILSLIPYTGFGKMIGLMPLPGEYWPFLGITVFLYMALATVLKKAYVKYYGELL